MAWVWSTPGDQPDSVPPRPAKMKALAPDMPLAVTMKSEWPLKTMPVGLALPAVPGGIDTTSDCGTPAPSYSVEVELDRFATQTKARGLKTTPHASTRVGSALAFAYSVFATGRSDTRLVATKPLAMTAAPPPAGAAAGGAMTDAMPPE